MTKVKLIILLLLVLGWFILLNAFVILVSVRLGQLQSQIDNLIQISKGSIQIDKGLIETDRQIIQMLKELKNK
mgnify:CR=1 FL=1